MYDFVTLHPKRLRVLVLGDDGCNCNLVGYRSFTLCTLSTYLQGHTCTKLHLLRLVEPISRDPVCVPLFLHYVSPLNSITCNLVVTWMWIQRCKIKTLQMCTWRCAHILGPECKHDPPLGKPWNVDIHEALTLSSSLPEPPQCESTLCEHNLKTTTVWEHIVWAQREKNA